VHVFGRLPVRGMAGFREKTPTVSLATETASGHFQRLAK
jgi:hypothetical protein